MVSGFPRILALLRKEKGISQRTAAQALGISQALLSHYENGVREPGLPFVVRASAYYQVSCDYLLGQSEDRGRPNGHKNGVEGAAQETGGNGPDTLWKENSIVNAVTLLLDAAVRSGNRALVDGVEDYLALCLYKVYRYLYMADPEKEEEPLCVSTFSFSEACDVEMKLCELQLRRLTSGRAFSPAGGGKETPVVRVSNDSVRSGYPTLAESFFTVLDTAMGKIGERISDMR